MKSLAERHLDRAQRKADNAAEFRGGTVPDIGAAVIAGRQFADLIEALPEAERDEVKTALADYDPAAARSIAEDENGNTMAGIGVVNTKVVPAMAEGGNGGGSTGGWVDIPKTDLGDPNGPNAGGAALVAQGAEGTAAPAGAKGGKAGKGEAE